jgi:hypothetical protein
MDQALNDADPIKQDQPIILVLKKVFRSSLTSIASKRLSNEHIKLQDLSVEEQNLWQSFDNSDIYKFISGEPDCLPKFQFNWIAPCQLAAHLPPGYTLTQLTPPPPQPDLVKQLVQQAHQPAQPPVAPDQPPEPPVPPEQVEQQPVPGPSTKHKHNLRPLKEIDYKELNTRVKSICCSLCQKAKAVVTKLAPGAFSPKPAPKDPPPDPENPPASS